MNDEVERDGQAERAPRRNVMLTALVERFGGKPPGRHRVRDLSTGGVRIDQAEKLHAGETVLVTVGVLEAVGATVIWVREGSAGLRFAQPIAIDDATARAAISSRPRRDAPPPAASVQAGWVRDLRDPYRR